MQPNLLLALSFSRRTDLGCDGSHGVRWPHSTDLPHAMGWDWRRTAVGTNPTAARHPKDDRFPSIHGMAYPISSCSFRVAPIALNPCASIEVPNNTTRMPFSAKSAIAQGIVGPPLGYTCASWRLFRQKDRIAPSLRVAKWRCRCALVGNICKMRAIAFAVWLDGIIREDRMRFGIVGAAMRHRFPCFSA